MLRIAATAVVVLAASIAQWGMVLAEQVAQGTAPTPTDLIPGTATTVAGTLLFYVVRMMATGKLVHSDHMSSVSEMTAAVERSNDLAEQSIELAEQAIRREEILTKLLIDRQAG